MELLKNEVLEKSYTKHLTEDEEQYLREIIREEISKNKIMINQKILKNEAEQELINKTNFLIEIMNMAYSCKHLSIEMNN